MACHARDSHVPAVATPGNTEVVQCTGLLASVDSIHLHSARCSPQVPSQCVLEGSFPATHSQQWMVAHSADRRPA